jgi:hypothetical protein
VEAAAAAVVAWSATAMVAAYFADRIGLALAPLPILALSLSVAIACWLRLRRHAIADRNALAAFVTIVAATFAWLMWRARPDFLPAGTGSDLTHHLSLLAFIEQHGRLPHEAAPGVYLGEMIDYTPGFHLLTVLVARCLHRDALHVAHLVVALTAAVKSGFVFLIARRLMPDGVPRMSFAIAAVLLVWLPYPFFAGSFMEQSFLSQVVSELFAIAMWWTIVEWRDRRSVESVALFAVFGMAAFLAWPIWVGPLALTLVAVMFARRDPAWRVRAQHLAIALVPIAVLAAIYAATRIAYGFDMIHAVGFVVRPSPRTMTWPFIIVAVAGVVHATTERSARPAAMLFVAIVLQAAALIAPGLRGSDVPYLSLKMAYLAIYPLSVAAAVFLGRVWRDVAPPATVLRNAWMPVAVIAIAVGVSVSRQPRPSPVIHESVFRAGEWAKAHVPAACVDYLVADGYTAYWLHLAVLGNTRATGRALDDATFEPQKAIVRWIVPGGLPYAIADRFDGLPRDIRTNVDVLTRFGPAAVIKRRGASRCADE